MSDSIYLDYAAATPMDNSVREAMEPYFTQKYYNPSAGYLAAKEVHQDLEKARANVAHWLGAKPSEIVFVAGGTEANNLAIHGLMSRLPDANVVASAIEHESVLEPAGKYDSRIATVGDDGRIDLEKLKATIDNQTVLVSIMYANNEIGTVQPIKDIARLISEERDNRRKAGNKTPIYLHTDACQAGNYLDLHVSRLGVDLMTINGGKIYGPKQSAVLYVKAGVDLQPIITGGGQERNLRSGTENIAAAVGFARALDLVQTDRHDEAARLQKIQAESLALIAQKLPSALVNGSTRFRLPNNIHLTLPGQDNERLLIQLDEAGIMAAAGSACSASDEDPSHVLRAIGLSDEDAQASIRLTMGRQTTAEMLGATIDKLAELIS